MRIARRHVTRFGCLHELALSFETVTLLVGATAPASESVLYALLSERRRPRPR